MVETDWDRLPLKQWRPPDTFPGRALKKDPRQPLGDIRDVQSQLALRLLAEANGAKRVGLAPVNPENS